MKWIRAFPHLTIILSVMCLVFFVIDRFNGSMGFLSNEITKWLVAALSLTASVTAVLCIGGYLRADEEADKEKLPAEYQRHDRYSKARKDRPWPFDEEV